MAEIVGKVGAIYYRKASITAATLAFTQDVGGDYITDSDGGGAFVTSGFANSMQITVSGAAQAGNNATWLIKSDGLAAGALTLTATEEVTTESQGNTITIVEALPGTQIAGFYNWSLDIGVDPLDKTDFENAAAGYRTRIASITDWTATAEGFWLTGSRYAWAGTEKVIRFFTIYDADPSAVDNYYYEGTGIVSGIDVNAPADELVKHTLRMEGNGAITSTTRSIAWPVYSAP